MHYISVSWKRSKYVFCKQTADLFYEKIMLVLISQANFRLPRLNEHFLKLWVKVGGHLLRKLKICLYKQIECQKVAKNSQKIKNVNVKILGLAYSGGRLGLFDEKLAFPTSIRQNHLCKQKMWKNCWIRTNILFESFL